MKVANTILILALASVTLWPVTGQVGAEVTQAAAPGASGATLPPEVGNTSLDVEPLDCPDPRAKGFVWTRFVNAKFIADFYPRLARNDDIKGRVKVKCAWGADGRVTDCRVLAEDPLDYGFGNASIAAMRAYGRVEHQDGTPIVAPGVGMCLTLFWAQ